MKVAFWNVGGMGMTGSKLPACKSWIANHRPDVIFFQEVSASLEHHGPGGDYSEWLWVPTLNKHGEASTKNLAVYGRQEYQPLLRMAEHTPLITYAEVQAQLKEEGRRSPDARREAAAIALEYQENVRLYIFGMHANASESGAFTSFRAADRLVSRAEGGDLLLIGGDFNTDSGALSAGLTKKISPLSYRDTILPFTQWDKDDLPANLSAGGPHRNDAEIRAYRDSILMPVDHGALNAWYKIVQPHRAIDYVLCSEGLRISALKNCSSADEWLTILREFDHAPVIYQIS